MYMYLQIINIIMSICTLVALQEKADMMGQLRTLERVDRVHRQKSLAKMPVSQGLL